MLKVRTIADADSGERLYTVIEGRNPAPIESLTRLTRFAAYLLNENGLAGTFRVAGEGQLALDLPAPERTFFHDGIVFAAVDVFNNPEKNPTITRLAIPEEEE